MEKALIDPLKALAEVIKSLPRLRAELQEAITESPEKLRPYIGGPISWAMHYETSLNHLTHELMTILETHEEFKIIAESGEHIVEKLESSFGDDVPEWLGDPNELEKTQNFFSTWTALIKSLTCIEYLGLSLQDLIEQAKTGDDEALFKAIRADRGILALPIVYERIADAEFFHDEAFFKKLSKALANPGFKNKIDYGALRFVLKTLHDIGELQKLSEQQRYELFCEKLDLYPDEEGEGSEGLNRFIRRWQKLLRT